MGQTELETPYLCKICSLATFINVTVPAYISIQLACTFKLPQRKLRSCVWCLRTSAGSYYKGAPTFKGACNRHVRTSVDADTPSISQPASPVPAVGFPGFEELPSVEIASNSSQAQFHDVGNERLSPQRDLQRIYWWNPLRSLKSHQVLGYRLIVISEHGTWVPLEHSGG